MSEKRHRSIARSAILVQTEVVSYKNKRWGINDEGTLLLNLGASVTHKVDVSQGAKTANAATKMGEGRLRGLSESEGTFYFAMVQLLGPSFGGHSSRKLLLSLRKFRGELP